MASSLYSANASVRPKIRGKCAVCHIEIPLINRIYHSLIPRPNNEVDERRKRQLVDGIQRVIDEILDISKSHIVCDSCYRNVTTIMKSDKLRDQLRQKHLDTHPQSSYQYRRSSPSPAFRTPTKTVHESARFKRMSTMAASPSALSPDKTFAKSPGKYCSKFPIPKPIDARKENTAPPSSPRSSRTPRSRQSPALRPSSITHVPKTTLFGEKPFVSTSGNEQRVTAEVTIHHAGVRKTRSVPAEWVPVAESLYHDDQKSAAEEASKLTSVKANALSVLVDDVKRECTSLCAKESKSSFKLSSPAALERWSPDDQDKELAEKAPILYTVLNSASINEVQVAKNKIKTREAVKHGMLSAAGILLNCRNKDINAHQVMTSLQLKQGGASQATVDRLQKRFICVNSDTQTSVQDSFRQDFDKQVKDWARQMLADDIVEKDLLSQLKEAVGDDADNLNAQLDAHNKARHPGFCLIGDNVDMKTHARYMGIGSQNKDMHMFNMLAAENRVPGYHLSNEKPIANISDVPLKEFLPNVEDNRSLKLSWIVHVGKILSKYLMHFRWLSNELPDVIPHKYSMEAKKKSKVVQLGVIDKNESTREGMRDITEHMHSYVPEDERTGRLLRILSVGDQLTVERQSAAQEEVRNSKTPAKRREGLMPVTGDFHLLGNFYQCMWKKIYNTGSVGDIGTIYASTKTMESHNVPPNPMKDINATKVFLDKYTDALVVAAALEFFGMEDVDGEPTKHKFNINEHGDTNAYIRSVIGDFVDQFALPAEEDISGASGALRCPKCLKAYTMMDALRDHLKKDHKSTDQDVDKHDAIFAHSCSALTMCLMCHDFTDARQAGDGERIIRLMKYMLLYFRSAGKSKYSLQVLRQLAQVKCLLTPREAHHVIHNRFVNNKGRVDTNVELDRVCEASNLVFKTHARHLHGQVTQKAIDRISQSCQAVDRVIKRVDKVSARIPSGSKRGGRDHTQDVVKLVGHLAHDRVFCKNDKGRYHKSFPGFTRGYVIHIDHAAFRQWMIKTLKGLSRKNVFRQVKDTAE